MDSSSIMNIHSHSKRVMIIAGESSGDLHGSKLVSAMRQKNQDLFFCGIGGQALKDAGVKILVDASELSVVGIVEVIPKMFSIIKGMSVVKKSLKALSPDLLILIDFPDFNLHIAATAKKLNIPVLYYISPQVWAWRSGRVRKIGKLVNHMAVILPFEEDIFRKHRVPATYVGHPLLDKEGDVENTPVKKRAGLRPFIGLLPGSRDREIARHLPVMLEAARMIKHRMNDLKFIISLAPAVERKFVEEIIAKHHAPIDYELIGGKVDSVFERCKLAIVASGTVTLESAISGTPMIIIYKVSPASYWLGRALIRVKHIGLVNLIANKRIVPELLQDEASPQNIAKTAIKMLSDDKALERLADELSNIRYLLGGPGASQRVADIALNML